MTQPDILNQEFIAVDTLQDVDLVAALRAHNGVDHELSWMWSLFLASKAGPEDHISFGVGVHGAMGALHWAQHGGVSLVPVDGATDESVCYYLGGLYESYVPDGSEIPVERVYEAVAEFIRTRKLPTCIQWQPSSALTVDEAAGPSPDSQAE